MNSNVSQNELASSASKPIYLPSSHRLLVLLLLPFYLFGGGGSPFPFFWARSEMHNGRKDSLWMTAAFEEGRSQSQSLRVYTVRFLESGDQERVELVEYTKKVAWGHKSFGNR